MFDVLGVVDLRGGAAVRAQGGRRDRYLPVSRVASTPIDPGDPSALVRAFVERCGIKALYVADLDAIEGAPPQRERVRTIAAHDTPIWLDAGIASVTDARRALDCGVARLIVGLETLPSFRVLESICRHAGSDRVVFSLDVRDGHPIAASREMASQTVDALVTESVNAGATAVIVLDLARVGSGAGPDLDLITRVRAAVPNLSLFAGGGVRDMQDLVQLKTAGCQGALVASALLDGALTPDDLLAVN